MKKNIYYYLIAFVTVTVCAYASEHATNDLRAATNNVQMTVSLAGNNKKIKYGEPLKLILRFKNISTNETFHFIQTREVTEIADYSFVINFPSGRQVSLRKKSLIVDSDTGPSIGPNETFERELEVNKVCQLDEAGTYKIIVQREIWGPLEKRKETGMVVEVPMFTIVSSPLFVQVVK